MPRAAISKLSRLDEKISLHPRLAELQVEVHELLGQFHDRAAAVGRFQEFLQRHEDALFEDTELTGKNPADSLVAIRTASLSALELYAAADREADRWALAPLAGLSEQESKDVVHGCYEMLMVLAEAVALPLPNESPVRQAHHAIQILDRAALLLPEGTQAMWLRRAACLERCGELEAAKRAKSIALDKKPSGAFDHFLSGLEYYKRGSLADAKLHFEAAISVKPKHFWSKCLLAVCSLNSRPPAADQARTHLSRLPSGPPRVAMALRAAGLRLQPVRLNCDRSSRGECRTSSTRSPIIERRSNLTAPAVIDTQCWSIAACSSSSERSPPRQFPT